MDFPVLLLRMYSKPYGNLYKYISRKFGINISPYTSVNEITIVTQSNKLNVKGKLGYLMARPPSKDAIDYQIARQVNLPIYFNSVVEIEELMKEYDYVIVASSDMKDTQKFCMFSMTFQGQVRVAHVSGNFKLNSAKVWFNTRTSNRVIHTLYRSVSRKRV